MRAKLFGQGLLLALATFVLAGTARAAAPISKAKPLVPHQTTTSFQVSYVAGTTDGTVTQVDLYASKDQGPYVVVGTVYDGTTPFVFNTDTRGDGYYAFFTRATSSTGENEAAKLPTSEADTFVDTKAPSTLDVSLLSINQQPSLVTGEVTGASGSVEANATVEMYADAALTTLLRSVTATSTGSFGPMLIGDGNVRAIWLAARDAAGNRGAAVKLDNNISYSGSLTNFVLSAEGDTTLVATFVAPANAQQFRVQYRHAGGAVWSVDRFDIGTNGTTIKITGLEAGRAYDVRIAPVDSRLNVGFWSATAARTTGAKVDQVTLPSEVVVATATPAATTTTTTAEAATTTEPSTAAVVEPVPTTTETKTDTTTPAANETSPDNSADAAPIEADNEAEANNAPAADSSSSATPWVILAILIVLAGIATGGYFYWFSGPEEVTTAVTPNESKKADKEPAEGSEDEDKRW